MLAIPVHLRKVCLSFVLLAVVAISCTKVPLTGRRQVNIISSNEMMSMSYEQYDTFLKENPVSKDSDQTARVRLVGNRIRTAVEAFFDEQGMSRQLDGYKWEFNLVDDDAVNAWCMPGGKVVFYSGILPVCRTDTGIAVVMGHEVAHAVANHGAERMSQGLLAQMSGAALAKALEAKPQATQQLWMTAFGMGAQFGVLLPFSRTQESEADHLGLIFMAMAGYDPNEAVSFWQRMSNQKGGTAPPEFMSTHPADATRIAQLKKLLPEALGYYKP